MTLLFTCFGFVLASEFCVGYKHGYIAGYCASQDTPQSQCIRPIVPICPIPDLMESSYQDGYARGFQEGLEG